MQTQRPPAKNYLDWRQIKEIIRTKEAPLAVRSAPAAPAAAPPATAPALGVAGHETQAAIEFATCIDNKTHEILFWCLDEHVDHYVKLFRAYPITIAARIKATASLCVLNKKNLFRRDW